MAYEQFVLNLSYIGVFLSMAATGFLGVFPPSKLVYIGAGVLASQGYFSLALLTLYGGIGHTLGNWAQYELARKKGKSILNKFTFIAKKDIDAFQKVFESKGLWFLFLGKLVDPVKAFISLCAGFAKTKRVYFLPIVLVGSFIWAIGFLALGFYFGKSYETYGPILGIIILVVGFALITFFYRAMKKVSEN